MATIVVYDPNDSKVANRVTKFDKSAHAPDYNTEANKTVNSDLSALWTKATDTFIVPQRYWKWGGGNTIVEMVQGEKDIIDAIDPEVSLFNQGVTGVGPKVPVDAEIQVERGAEANASFKWDETLQTWVIGLYGQEVEVADVDIVPQNILDLDDVRKPMSPSDGDVLTWNNGTTEWENRTPTQTVLIKKDGSTVTGGPFTTINFIGGDITAVDGGGNECDVTVTPSNILRPTFAIWAEENGAVSVSSTNYEYSFGNGATNNGISDAPGIPMGVEATLIGIGVSARGNSSGTNTVSISVTKNGVVVATGGIAAAAGQNAKVQNHTDITPDTVTFAKGDTVQFLTATKSGTIDDVRVVAWFERTA